VKRVGEDVPMFQGVGVGPDISVARHCLRLNTEVVELVVAERMDPLEQSSLTNAHLRPTAGAGLVLGLGFRLTTPSEQAENNDQGKTSFHATKDAQLCPVVNPNFTPRESVCASSPHPLRHLSLLRWISSVSKLRKSLAACFLSPTPNHPNENERHTEK
jgi:hypothetical protein